jgi:putative PIN family toxin of toxin-antitoxin system
VIRVTLDVNVLVSGFTVSNGAPAQLIERWQAREFDVVLSEAMLNEAVDVWQRPYWAARYSPNQIQRTLLLLQARARVVIPADVHGVAEDEEDDLVLATAIAGNAAFLVTGDKFLQAIGQYQNVVILSPRQFLEILQRERDGQE